jgi:hypothetical protein
MLGKASLVAICHRWSQLITRYPEASSPVGSIERIVWCVVLLRSEVRRLGDMFVRLFDRSLRTGIGVAMCTWLVSITTVQ